MSLVRLILADVPNPCGPGLSGLVGAVDALLPRPQRSFSLAANVLLSGAGVRAYQLDPADNYAFDLELPGVEYRADALDVDNYGALEALGGYWGVGPRRYPSPSLAELVQLCRHELGEGRGVVLDRRGAAVRFRRVVGVQVGAAPSELPPDVAASAVETLEYDLTQAPPPPSAVDAAWVIRPDPMPGPASRWHALQRDLLRFALEHHGRKFELVHDAELFYATGRRAIARSRTLVAGTERATAQPELRAYLVTWLLEHAQSYAMGAEGCAEWAAAVDQGDPAWVNPDGGPRWLRSLAATLGALSGALWAAHEALSEGELAVATAALDAAIALEFPEPPATPGLLG